MKVAVIGLGSMGKRRIRLINELFPSCEIIGVDSREDRREDSRDLFMINSYNSLSNVPNDVNCAFVCTSPLSHASIINDCLQNKWDTFTELNLVSDGYEENISLAKRNGCTLFLSSTFMYREEIKKIRSMIDPNHMWNYVYHIGQYLPDWHPWENFNDYFIGDKKTNGCREILAIELPWLVKTFGKIQEIHSSANKMSALKIEYNDNYCIQITHDNGNKGVLVVDVVCPLPIRNFHTYTEGKYISWDGTPDSLYEYDSISKKLVNIQLNEEIEHTEGYSNFIVENAYKNEIISFFHCIENGKEPEYGFEEDMTILSIIDSIGA